VKIFILILTFYAGPPSRGDSVALTTAEFSSQENCNDAGEAAVRKFKTVMKPAQFVCVEK
jgi:hypothetical protein